jgi:ATP-dependent DNA helicase RecG
MDDPGTRDPKELLLGLGLLEDDQLLNAAVVLFGQANQLLPGFPQCLLRMARFRGTTKTEFEDNRQEHGHAFELLERAQRFMRDHLPVAGRIVPDLFERKDDPLYPPEALREAVANALCHRNYGTGGGSVGIAIFDDRLEISSTGTLPPNLTPEALRRSHASQPRNKLIADVFYRRGIIEQWGRGTIRITELTEQAGLVSPEFEERNGEVVVRFLPTRYIAPSRIEHDLTHLQRRVLQTVARSGPAMLSEIVESLSVGAGESPKRRAVQNNLQTLRSLELVELKGRGRGARWMLAENGA